MYGNRLSRHLGLEGFWDEVYKVAGGVQTVADTVRRVKSGDTTVVATIDRTGVKAVPISRPALPTVNQMAPLLLAGGGLLVAYLFLRRRRS